MNNYYEITFTGNEYEWKSWIQKFLVREDMIILEEIMECITPIPKDNIN